MPWDARSIAVLAPWPQVPNAEPGRPRYWVYQDSPLHGSDFSASSPPYPTCPDITFILQSEPAGSCTYAMQCNPPMNQQLISRYSESMPVCDKAVLLRSPGACFVAALPAWTLPFPPWIVCKDTGSGTRLQTTDSAAGDALQWARVWTGYICV